MLPTVIEESEEELSSNEAISSNILHSCSLQKNGNSSNNSTPQYNRNYKSIYSPPLTPVDLALCIGYPLDITHLLKQYTEPYSSCQSNKPIVIITPGLPDIEVANSSTGCIYKMTDCVTANNIGSSNGSISNPPVGRGDHSPTVASSGVTAHDTESHGATTAAEGKEQEDHKAEDQHASKTRKDSDSGGRSGGEGERRNNRRFRNNRAGQWRNRDKKWWVCPDSACRHRNPVDSKSCSNCGLLQDTKGSSNRESLFRNWEKSRATGLVSTHVSSPTTLYMQTQQQQADYARLRNCMMQSYAAASYRPSLVAAKMLLGVKIGDSYERVRTEERREGGAVAEVADTVAKKQEPLAETLRNGSTGSPAAEGSKSPSQSPSAGPVDVTGNVPGLVKSTEGTSESVEWRVQLVDRGSWGWVKEDDLNFLLAGLSDLAPLAAKYTLNELRVKRDSTEQSILQSRQWLEDKLKDAKVDGDIYRQTKDQSSVLYIDLYKGDTLLNRSICELGAVEPKMNLRWLKSGGGRVSTSSVEDGTPPSPSSGVERGHEGTTAKSQTDDRSGSASPPDNDNKQQRSQPREGDGRSRPATSSQDDNADNSSTGRNSRSTTGYWNNRRKSRDSRQQQRSLPPLHDWAVLCFDQRTSHPELRSLCEMVERVGKESRVSISSADSIRMEFCEDDSCMETVLSDVIATHPRLLLLLCVLPNHVQDYSKLEHTGRSLGVCVVCVRGDSVAQPSTSTATTLLRDLQSALLQSPAILPDQGQVSNGFQNRRRRDNRGRRAQNRQQRGWPAGGSPSTGDGNQECDPRLQAVIGAASQGIALLQKLSQQPGGQQLPEASLSPGMKSLLQSPASHADIAKALQSLDELQGSYKQARSYTHEAFEAAGKFFSHLSNAITPGADAAPTGWLPMS